MLGLQSIGIPPRQYYKDKWQYNVIHIMYKLRFGKNCNLYNSAVLIVTLPLVQVVHKFGVCTSFDPILLWNVHKRLSNLKFKNKRKIMGYTLVVNAQDKLSWYKMLVLCAIKFRVKILVLIKIAILKGYHPFKCSLISKSTVSS